MIGPVLIIWCKTFLSFSHQRHKNKNDKTHLTKWPKVNKSHSQLGLSYLDEWTGHGWVFSQISFRCFFPINFILKQVGCQIFWRIIKYLQKQLIYVIIRLFVTLNEKIIFLWSFFLWYAHLIMSWEQNEHKFDSILSKFFRRGSMTILHNFTPLDSV